MDSKSSIFQAGKNCWHSSQADFARPLIDAAEYYQALHSSICKAKHSIFIVGWDIDSRIRLLRGEAEEASEAPSIISDLLAWKAKQNPDIKIYLLRWDSSLAFFSQREMWAKEAWDEKTPNNVKTELDDTIPMGGSQHQKVVVIDDEIAFSGGMDVSTNRWDTREHLIDQPYRVGPGGSYSPLHDVQIVSAGSIVEHFAKLVRWRWDRICNDKAIGYEKPKKTKQLPYCWPDDYDPQLKQIPCALARTIPFMDEVDPVQEVRHLLLDLINEAEHFIYIENQFTTRQEIAEALNKQLKAKPALQVLIVSSYEPKGKFESEAYWASRIDFKNILENGIEPGRILLSYSSIQDKDGKQAFKRIHSKVMSIDNQYLVIGSSNISNRSMSLDTEVDLVFYGDSQQNSQDICRVRNDLLAEHTGRSIERVAELMEKSDPLKALINEQPEHQYTLAEVEDSRFTEQSWQSFFGSISDPEEPLLPAVQSLDGKLIPVKNPRRRTIMTLLGIVLVAILATIIIMIGHAVPWLDAENLSTFLEESRGTLWTLPTILLVYVIGGLLFMPVTLMSLAVAAIFGPIYGPLYGILGALLSSAILFQIGKLLGNAGLRKVGGPKVAAVDEKFKNSGIVGVAAIRLLPIAPFSLVNLIAGVSSINILTFLAGTFLGMFPPMIAKGLVGDSLAQIFTDPSPQTIGYLVGGIVLWIVMIIAAQKFAKYYQQKKAQKCTA